MDESEKSSGSEGEVPDVAELLERHQGDLHAFVRLRYGRLLRGRESSRDLVQSVCREILEHADRFEHREDEGFRRWLFTTTMRKIKNRQAYYLAGKRDVMREAMPRDDRDSDDALMQHYRTFSTPSRVLSAREQVERVEEAFEVLTDEQRDVLTLAHMAGLSRAEIAEQLGKSEGAVRVTLHRALAKLSAKLDDA